MHDRSCGSSVPGVGAVVLAMLTWFATDAARAQEAETTPPSALAASGPVPAEVLARLSVVERATVRVIALTSVAAVRVAGEMIAVPEVSYGSGVVVSSDGVILTARHVVEKGLLVAVWRPGESVPSAAVVAHQAEEDYALLVVPGDFPDLLPLPNADAAPEAATRTRVFAFGYPEDLFETLPAASEGIVSRQSVTGLYQVTAAVNPGNSGGPLVDAEDRLLGVVVLRHLDAEGMGYALPIGVVAAAYPGIRDSGVIDSARAQVAAPDWAGHAELASLNARWAVADAGEGPGGWLETIVEACGAAVSVETAAVAARLEELVPHDPTGAAALLFAAYQWNVAICDAHQVGLGSTDLLAAQPVRAWIAGQHPTLRRIFSAIRAVRQAGAANPVLLERSSFAEALLAYEGTLARQVQSFGSVYPPPVEGSTVAVGPVGTEGSPENAAGNADPRGPAPVGMTSLAFRSSDAGVRVVGVPTGSSAVAAGSPAAPMLASQQVGCIAPCELLVPDGTYSFWVEDEPFTVHAAGGEQEWDVDGSSSAASIWGQTLTYGGLGMLAFGAIYMGVMDSDSESDWERDGFYIGAGLVGAGGLALLIGIPLWATAGASAVRLSTTPASASLDGPWRGLALVPGSVGRDPDTGRPAWGVRLALTF
ncbi:MAG: trypsin-like peptidase domain-containing protein [Deltaproteobacteria bacterium]|nr:trypsin-like peptidase domain-containing protein [Deltaproteobacteria bacterium]